MSPVQEAVGPLLRSFGAVSEARIGMHVRRLEGVRHPVADPEALARAERYVADELDRLGYAVERHRFRDPCGDFHNVIGTRTGRLLPDKRVLVLAHFDTVAGSPGADDNASGVAVLLELAAALGDFLPEKTLQFVGVNLEENGDEEVSGTGLRGSRALARLARSEGWEIEAVVVLESVGFAAAGAVQSAPAGLPLEVPKVGDFVAVVGNERSRGVVERFILGASGCGEGLRVVPVVVPGNGELFRDTRRSDHAPFWDEGYPAVMLTDTTNFRSPHYHEPSDTFDTLNLAFAASVCRATAALLVDLTALPATLP